MKYVDNAAPVHILTAKSSYAFEISLGQNWNNAVHLPSVHSLLTAIGTSSLYPHHPQIAFPKITLHISPAMQDFIGSVRRSLVFKPSGEDPAGFGGFVEKIGSSIRKSRIGIFSKPPVHALPPISTPQRGTVRAPPPPMEEEALPPMEGTSEDEPRFKRERAGVMLNSRAVKEEEPKMKKEVSLPPPIRWRKGELIGCGAFGRVHMGMNLDSGELLAVKEVSIAANNSSKKTQEYIGELEKEVNLLKNLSHPNIVRYLGTAREEDSLNILLEFVPGGSISSLLGKFGSFPESVIRMYTKQLLLGLEYLHKNKIMHRDIKGANILVDNKGCIKLADFGASKKVEALLSRYMERRMHCY
ncbi:mitogen-activated protein kinase kinase kinase [Striga asiatica]|uniref:mitogen-activated protein kinase kinase kinase n=1 Tax=Striga asiatica TaxID=4170 RepID=A0A5A7QHA1_STRAF|nr:mitogen-activated protein kinase kinase kinase [Striga asiatica]